MNTSSYKLNEFVYCIRYANLVNGNNVDHDLDQLSFGIITAYNKRNISRFSRIQAKSIFILLFFHYEGLS